MRICSAQYRHIHLSSQDLIVVLLQEDAGEAIESGGFAELARPWRYSRKLKAALLAEFIGMAIFQIYGGNSPDSGAHMPIDMRRCMQR